MSGATPTYVSATQFTVPGNLVATYSANRRVQTVNTAGTYYGYVTSSSYSSVTTVNVALDSGALDSGLSAVSVALLGSTNPSVPQQYPQFSTPTAVTAASTATIAAGSANIAMSGSTGITAFDAAPAGIRKWVAFSGAPLLTYNGTSLILLGAANIQTAAGDQAVFRSLGSGNWTMESYSRVNGLAYVSIPPIIEYQQFGGI